MLVSMSEGANSHRLILIGLDFDEATAFDIKNKGWYGLAKLRLDDGTLIPLSFYDPIRLRQEVAEEFTQGKGHFAEANLIVVPNVTEAAMRQAATELWDQGFFTRTKD